MAELAPPLDEDAIKQLVPFNELLRHQFQEALKCCELLTLPPRKKLFKRGERDAYWYYLLKGSAGRGFQYHQFQCRRSGVPASPG